MYIYMQYLVFNISKSMFCFYHFFIYTYIYICIYMITCLIDRERAPRFSIVMGVPQ